MFDRFLNTPLREFFGNSRNNKNNRTTSTGVFIVTFEQVNVSCVSASLVKW